MSELDKGIDFKEIDRRRDFSVMIHLFGKPAWEMDIEGKEGLDPDMFREKGEQLKEQLNKVVDVVV